jgi:hypothetical protein
LSFGGAGSLAQNEGMAMRAMPLLYAAVREGRGPFDKLGQALRRAFRFAVLGRKLAQDDSQ